MVVILYKSHRYRLAIGMVEALSFHSTRGTTLGESIPHVELIEITSISALGTQSLREQWNELRLKSLGKEYILHIK